VKKHGLLCYRTTRYFVTGSKDLKKCTTSLCLPLVVLATKPVLVPAPIEKKHYFGKVVLESGFSA
jgi:hypothetical protein